MITKEQIDAMTPDELRAFALGVAITHPRTTVARARGAAPIDVRARVCAALTRLGGEAFRRDLIRAREIRALPRADVDGAIDELIGESRVSVELVSTEGRSATRYALA